MNPEDGARQRWSRWIPWAAAAVAFVIYALTMNRTYGFIDKGELAAVATTLGIAHPTGYPTLTLLGHVCTRLSPLRPVLTLNLLAALLTAAGVGLMAAVFDGVLRLPSLRQEEKPREAPRQERRSRARRKSAGASSENPDLPSLTSGERAVIAGTAALFTGFTATWWGQATGFEVYALHALLLPLVTLLFLRYLDSVERPDPSERLSWPGSAFAFTLGLS